MKTPRPPAPCLVWNRPSIQGIPAITAFRLGAVSAAPAERSLRRPQQQQQQQLLWLFSGRAGWLLYNMCCLCSGTIRIHSHFPLAWFYCCAANEKEWFTALAKKKTIKSDFRESMHEFWKCTSTVGRPELACDPSARMWCVRVSGRFSLR